MIIIIIRSGYNLLKEKATLVDSDKLASLVQVLTNESWKAQP